MCRFVTWLSFNCEELLAPRRAIKLEDHPLSTGRDCSFNIFAVTFHIWTPFLHPQLWLCVLSSVLQTVLLNLKLQLQGGSNMTGTNCDLFTHKSSRSYLNHLVYFRLYRFINFSSTVFYVSMMLYIMTLMSPNLCKCMKV